jgi:hypothetical protein
MVSFDAEHVVYITTKNYLRRFLYIILFSVSRNSFCLYVIRNYLSSDEEVLFHFQRIVFKHNLHFPGKLLIFATDYTNSILLWNEED